MPVHRFLILPLLGWTIASAGCDQEPSQAVVEERVIPVSAMRVRRQSSFVYPSTYYGRIEPARRAALSFELPGLLVEVTVDEGDEIIDDAEMGEEEDFDEREGMGGIATVDEDKQIIHSVINENDWKL